MKKGTLVTVYIDPVTQLKKKGTAKLVRHNTVLSTHPDYRLELWVVRFTGDTRNVTRTIREDIKRETAA